MQRTCAFLVAIALIIGGCATTGEMVTLDMEAVKIAEEGEERTATLTISVAPFEDARLETQHIGVRRHLLGGTTHYNVQDGKVGDVFARAVVDHLKTHGWQAELAQGATMSSDVAISGKVLEFTVNASSQLFSTEITSNVKFQIEAVNKADGSTLKMTPTGTGSQRVFWFDTEDAQSLGSAVLTDAVHQFPERIQVEGKSLRLK